ncbi:retrovirus-related pol polyprotein from transposon TNT 1-94 [Tanacetum coccineum]|uniref:Retrovirus-related pol polyprotein from transposon TNT 1-94 n=1 Tax=Tanacetum coccineum TaxID=301880 RepID=A0ABQ5J163_9ASTR
MEDEHLNTIPETESDEENESSVKDLNLTPSESEDLSEDLSDYKSECDVPVCDDSSSKNEGLDDIVSIPPGKEIDHLDSIPDSVQSLLNRANSIIFLIEEFVGELAPIDPIPPGIVEADFDPKEDIRLIEKLLNDDSSPEELNSEIPDAIIESFSISIPVEDSDSLMEEIDIFLAPDDLIPPGIENDDYDSEGVVLFLKELLNNDSISLPEYESCVCHVDFYNVLSSLVLPEKTQLMMFNGLDTGVLTTKVVDDISDNSTRELYVHLPNVLPTHLTLYPVYRIFTKGQKQSQNNKTKHGNGKSVKCQSQRRVHLKWANPKVEESLNVTFDETPPPSKTSPLVDDDLDEEEAIKVTEKKNLENDIEDETLEIDEIVNIKESRNHPLENVIGNLNQRTLRSQAQNQSNFFCFISTIEPKNVNEALTDDSWIVAMQEELNQFIANDVWELVPQPRNMTIIGTKWVFRNKLDENVARLESIRILLAYACALDFKLFQMDVKSAFLNGFINEEVYVAQPPGFIDFEKPDHVYKLKKALYGLKQAPKA